MTAPSVITRDSLATLRPGRTDRAVFVGKTGSGKTTLARVLMDSVPYVVVHDAKGMIAWKGYTLCRGLRALDRRHGDARLIYRPTARELLNPEDQETFFRWVYLRRNCLVYVDELYSLVGGHGYSRPPSSYLACLTRGRERGIGVWSATQRPARVPLVALSEAEHCYLFALRLAGDRKRMEDEWGITRAQQGMLSDRRHDFWYGSEAGTRGPYVLAPHAARPAS